MNGKAVSQIIGTMLMVAVVVILSAIVAGLVFGLIHKVKSAPCAEFVLSYAQSNITSTGGVLFIATLYGGDVLTCKDIKFQILNVSTGTAYELTWNDTLGCFVYHWNSTRFDMYAFGDCEDGSISPGDEIVFNETTPIISSGTTVELSVVHIPTNTIIYVGDVVVR